MAVTTVRDLAEQTRTPVDRLLAQLADAGVKIDNADAEINPDQKRQWLEHLQGQSDRPSLKVGGARKLSIKRKEQSELKVTPGRGQRTKTINVEVRKKRVVVQPPQPEAAPAAPEPVAQEELPTAQAEPDQDAKVAATQDTAKPAPKQEATAQAKPEPKADADKAPVEEQSAPAEAAAPSEDEAKPAAEEEAKVEVKEPAAPAEAVAEEPEAEPEAAAKSESAAVDEAKPEKQPQPAEQPAKAADEPEQDAAKAAEAAKSAEATPADETNAAPDAGEDPKLRTEVSSLRKRVLENLRRAKEQEAGLTKAKEELEREKTKAGKLAKAKARAGGRRGANEQLHVAADKRGRRRKGGRRNDNVKVETTHKFERPTAPVVREVEVHENMTVGDLASALAVKAGELIKVLMGMGVMATINQTLDTDTAQLVVEEMGHTVKRVASQDREEELLEELKVEDATDLVGRAPVVTIMGHVDHGKTTLLDYIRKARVAQGEAGGITQHIGAYRVQAGDGTVTFLDTPGHAAFTRMRARGAAVTDVVILVVAADDSVMPQTREAVDHARAAGVPIVVAMTKIDKENSDPDRVKNDLSKLELIPEDWGGDSPFIGVSGITGEGVDELLETVALQAEILELKARADGPAEGVVVESSIERGRGSVATVLVRSGTLRKGDQILAGQYFGRVRALFDDQGKPATEAGPATPVRVLGLDGTPDAGDEVLVVSDERKAKELAEVRAAKLKESRARSNERRLAGDWTQQLSQDEARVLNIVLKGDVQGSVEALIDSLTKLSTDEVSIKVVGAGVGGISESDVDLSHASEALLVGFNTRADAVARRRAGELGIEPRYYSVIYDLINDVRDAASGLLGTETAEKIVGVAMVRDVFRSSKFGAVAGCLVEEGSVRRGLPIRVLRDNVVIFEGELESLRRHKDDVNRVESGTECGIAVKNYNDVHENDRIECFERVEVKRTLEESAEA
nr:translation initiation factor IF-2 [Oceanococcus sp. HetDA_MAG_MS8]